MDTRQIINKIPLIFLMFTIAFYLNSCSKKQVLISFDSERFELYAPTEEDLNSAIPQLEYAVDQMKLLLGTDPPKIAVLLFSSNKELVNYDYSELRKKEMIFLPWLTKAGMIDLMKSVDKPLVTTAVTDVTWPINFPSLGIWVINNKINADSIIEVNGVETADFREAWDLPPLPEGFWLEKRDIIKKMNSIAYKNIVDFEDAFYSIPESSKITLDVIRNGREVKVIFLKPKAEKPNRKTFDEDDDSEYLERYFDKLHSPLSHEAGHIFFIAYVQQKFNQFYPEMKKYFNIMDFAEDTLTYGHPNIPDWLDEAIAILCESAESQQGRIWAMKQNVEQRVTLKEFILMMHPKTEAELKNPNSKHDYSSKGVSFFVGTESFVWFYEQAIAFAQYIIEMEGYDFIGEIVRGYIASQDFETILQYSKKIPRDIKNLEAEWLKWLENFEIEN